MDISPMWTIRNGAYHAIIGPPTNGSIEVVDRRAADELVEALTELLRHPEDKLIIWRDFIQEALSRYEK